MSGPRIAKIEAKVHHDVIAFNTAVAEYIGNTRRAALARIAYCCSGNVSSSSGVRRQRASKRRRSTPSPVHGTSTSTRSAFPYPSSFYHVPFHSRTRTDNCCRDRHPDVK